MRKVYFTLAFIITAAAVQAQVAPRKLTWSRTGNYQVSSAATFTQSSNWGGYTPANNDTLYINNASVEIRGNVDLTSLSNIVIVLGTPASAAPSWTLGITRRANFSMSASSAISVRSGGKAYVAGSTSFLRQFIIGGDIKMSNFLSATNFTANGPSSASSSTPVATSASFATAGFIAGTLPVVLVSFDAVKQSNGVALNWKTQQESNTSFFAIEKSTDGMSYSEIARVAAAGNASTPRSYSYTDAAALKGMAYYRVRIVDLDGKSGLTMVKAVRATASAAKVSLYPNPAVSVANLVVDNPESLAFGVNVFNRNGQLVARKNAAAGATAVALEVSSFPAGDYMIDVQFSNGTRQSSKLIVASH